MTDYATPRDRWGRPQLYTPEGGKRTAYTRISTAAKWCDDKGGLIDWKASQVMVGLMKSRPLQARISAIIARTQEDVYRENKAALKEIVETASTIAQSSGRADYGTAVHEFSEMLDLGILDWEFVPEKLKGPLEAYREALRGWRVVDTEVFVTVDEEIDRKAIRLAGSMDRLLFHPDYGTVVADLKTGADEPKYSLGVTTQVAAYSRGRRYRDDVFLGTPAFTDGEANADGSSWRKPLWENLNQKIGVMIHCPLEPVNGRYECSLYELDLERGMDCLTLGHRVQTARRPPKLKRLK